MKLRHRTIEQVVLHRSRLIKFQNWLDSGGEKSYVTEFEHEIPYEMNPLIAQSRSSNDNELRVSFHLAFRFLARNEKLGQSWSPTINNLCRIGEFHQPRFLTRRGFDVTFYRGHQFCLIGRLSKKLFARGKNTFHTEYIEMKRKIFGNKNGRKRRDHKFLLRN